MTGTNHAITGALIGMVVAPVAIVPLAVISHLALDALPHYGDKALHQSSRRFQRIILIDTIVTVLFLISILIWRPAHWLWAFGAALLAMSPDMMWLPNYIRAVRGRPMEAHNKLMHVHEHMQRERVWGWMVEAVWLAILLPVFYLHARNF